MKTESVKVSDLIKELGPIDRKFIERRIHNQTRWNLSQEFNLELDEIRELEGHIWNKIRLKLGFRPKEVNPRLVRSGYIKISNIK